MKNLRNKDHPLVSVIMPTYQENLFLLKKSILSILNQSFQYFEFIIIIEPNDINASFLRKKAAKNNKIKLIFNKKKLGFVTSLNIGINYSRSDFIVRMDSDDYSDKLRLEKQYCYMVENPQIDVLGSSIYLIEKSKKQFIKRNYPSTHEQILKRMIFFSPMAHPSTMIRKKCLKNFGLYDENFVKCEDLELWLRLGRNGCIFHNLSDPLLYYNYNKKNVLRDKLHWQFNYKARKMHQSYLYKKNLISVSRFFFLLISLFNFKKIFFIYTFITKFRNRFNL